MRICSFDLTSANDYQTLPILWETDRPRRPDMLPLSNRKPVCEDSEKREG